NSVPLDLGADETVHKKRGDSVERAITTDASLVAEHDSDNIIRTQTTTMPNVDIPQGMDTGGIPRRQETMGGAPSQTSGEGMMAHTFELMDIVPPTPHDSPLPRGYTPGSDEGRLKLEELMAMCTKLSKQVLDLEKEKDAQAVEILKLKKRVKKLERQRKSSISHLRRRIYRQVESSDDDLDKDDASKQGMKSDKIKPMFKDSDFDGLDDDMENVEGETIYAATSGVSTAGALVSTARPTVSTGGPSTSAAGTLIGTDKSKITRKQLKASKHGRENQKSSKRSQRFKAEAKNVKPHDEDAAADYELEKEELRMWLTVVPDEEKTVDPEDFVSKVDGNTSYYKSLFSMLRKFDRQDLVDLHRLMMKFGVFHRIRLCVDETTVCNCRVIHVMDGTLTCFNMLVEKRYPLIKEMLEKMLNWKLEAEAESTMAFELLKFIKSQLEDWRSV
ncbi:hypothetical protein Tco_0708108, partial [Tanacetum coccineum]